MIVPLAYTLFFLFLSVQAFAQSLKTVNTPLGVATGVQGAFGSVRFTVKYASAARWGSSTPATSWTPPNGSNNVTALPLACPQPTSVPQSEDCLSMVLYVPTFSQPMPTLVWVHGGSFIVGSATGPGLDASELAAATSSIVAVVQYRLGALGFLPPSGQTNLALTDLVNALHFLQTVVPSFNGNPSKITVAGQSSGASLIRALLAAPSANSLFQSAILMSSPMNFGFLSPATQQTLQSNFNSQIGCSPTDTTCLNNLPLSTIVNAEMTTFTHATSLDPSTGQFEPIRPVHDGTLVTSPLDTTAPFPQVSKPLIITSVLDDAGAAFYSSFPNPVPQVEYQPILAAVVGQTRATQVINSPYYVPTAAQASDVRPLLESIGTDLTFRCPSWTLARNWVSNGGTAYVGVYYVGATYPGNEQVPFCTQPGDVCHQDDIEVVFGTAPNPTPAQLILIAQMQVRFRSFLWSGQPNLNNGNNPLQWPGATSTNVHALSLGGNGESPAGACDPSFWGNAVQYDYQVYNI